MRVVVFSFKALGFTAQVQAQVCYWCGSPSNSAGVFACGMYRLL